jgi:multidrug efflux system outer membrane protein
MYPALLGFLCVLSIVRAPPLNAVPGGIAGGDSLGEAPVLSLDDAIRGALEHSVNLQKSRVSLEGEEYAAKRLWAELFPSISASAGISYQNNPLFTGTDAEREFTEQRLNYTTSVGLELSLSAGIPYRMRLLNLAYRQQLLSYEDTRRLLEIATAQSFYALIAEGENLSHLAETLGLAERQLEKTRTARANGLVSEMALLQSQVGVEAAKYDLSTAQAAYDNQLGVFLSSLGLPPQLPVVLRGEFSIRQVVMDPEELIRDYLPRRPDIEQQRRAIEKLELAERQKTMEARAPSLSFSLSWGGGSSGAGPFADRINGSASVRIPVNAWIPGTKESQTLRVAQSEIEKALLELKNTEDAAAAQIRSLTANLRNAWESLEIARLREQVAQRSYELTERGFLNGAVESLSLETSRGSLAAARYQLLRSELAYQSLVLDLARAINADWRQFIRSAP